MIKLSGTYAKSSLKFGSKSRFLNSQAAVAQRVAEESAMPSVPKMPPFDYSPLPYDGPSAEEILRKRKEFLSPSMFHLYEKPVSKLISSFLILFAPQLQNMLTKIFFFCQ